MKFRVPSRSTTVWILRRKLLPGLATAAIEAPTTLNAAPAAPTQVCDQEISAAVTIPIPFARCLYMYAQLTAKALTSGHLRG